MEALDRRDSEDKVFVAWGKEVRETKEGNFSVPSESAIYHSRLLTAAVCNKKMRRPFFHEYLINDFNFPPSPISSKNISTFKRAIPFPVYT